MRKMREGDGAKKRWEDEPRKGGTKPQRNTEGVFAQARRTWTARRGGRFAIQAKASDLKKRSRKKLGKKKGENCGERMTLWSGDG